MSDPSAPTELDVGGPEDQLLAWPRVHEITGLSRTTIWRLQRIEAFPRPVALSPGRVGWWQSELMAWRRTRSQGPFKPPKAPRLPGMPRSRAPAPEVVATPEARVSPEAATILSPALKRRKKARAVPLDQIDFGF